MQALKRTAATSVETSIETPIETVEDFACQLAGNQLARYLAGERLSPEAVAQLESHVASCARCRERVLNRREEVRQAVDETPPDPPGVKSPRPSWKLVGSAKPVVLSGCLALVLVAMSYVGRNPSALFGDRVITSSAKTKGEPPRSVAAPSGGVAEAPPVAVPKQAPVKAETRRSEPKAATPITPVPRTELAAKRVQPRKASRRRTRQGFIRRNRPESPAAASSGIRIYSPDGQLKATR